MSIEYLFSGADPTARDALLTVRPPGVRTRDLGAFARTAMTVTFALASICSVQSSAFAYPGHVEVGSEIAPVIVDETGQRVLDVRSDGEQPSVESRRIATELVDRLRAEDLEPDRVLADPEGGVALYVFGESQLSDGSHSRYARIVATNSGEVAVLCADREGGSPLVWDVKRGDRVAAVKRVHAFLRGH
jgi:hypothetical protein